MIEFVKTVFSAEETFRTVGSAGGIHAEVRFGDTMLMIGGGGPDLAWKEHSRPMAFHVYVPDTDATYQRALAAGAASLSIPADQHWGERTANVRDSFGNNWYIATRTGSTWFFEGGPILQPYLHPVQPEPLIGFINRAFGAEEEGRAVSPEGRILHTTLKIGNGSLEISQAEGPYQPMPSMFYLYVPDVDASCARALEAGATSISAPADQSYGDRRGGVADAFGNQWYMATHIGQVAA